MKHIALFLLALPSFTGIFAQKNTLALDLRYLPACEVNVAGASLNFFRAVGERRSLGFKTTWNTDALGLESWEVRTHVLNLDVVNRWNLSKKSKVNWFVEAGISGLCTIERTPPRSFWGFCGTGLTDEEIEKQKEYYSQWHTETEFMLGFATATSLEFPLSQHFSLGAALVANVYYSPSDDAIYPYLVPSLRTAFSF